MTVTDSNDFNNVNIDIGETVTIHNQTEVVSSDYGSLTTQTLGAGTSETAIIQPEKESVIQASEGRIQQGDLFAMFRSDSVVTEKSIIKYGLKPQKKFKPFKCWNIHRSCRW